MNEDRWGNFQPGDRVVYRWGNFQAAASIRCWETGDRVVYLHDKLVGVLIRRCHPLNSDDWIVDWDGRDEPTTAKTCNLSLVARKKGSA